MKTKSEIRNAARKSVYDCINKAEKTGRCANYESVYADGYWQGIMDATVDQTKHKISSRENLAWHIATLFVAVAVAVAVGYLI